MPLVFAHSNLVDLRQRVFVPHLGAHLFKATLGNASRTLRRGARIHHEAQLQGRARLEPRCSGDRWVLAWALLLSQTHSLVSSYVTMPRSCLPIVWFRLRVVLTGVDTYDNAQLNHDGYILGESVAGTKAGCGHCREFRTSRFLVREICLDR